MGGAGYGLYSDTIACGGAAPVGFSDIGADNIVFRADKMNLRNCRNLRRDIGEMMLRPSEFRQLREIMRQPSTAAGDDLDRVSPIVE